MVHVFMHQQVLWGKTFSTQKKEDFLPKLSNNLHTVGKIHTVHRSKVTSSCCIPKAVFNFFLYSLCIAATPLLIRQDVHHCCEDRRWNKCYLLSKINFNTYLGSGRSNQKI